VNEEDPERDRRRRRRRRKFIQSWEEGLFKANAVN